MKNSEMFAFVQNFDKFDGLEGFDFVLLLNKNKRFFEHEIKLMQQTRENNPGFKAYRDATQEILKKYADKDSKGEPIVDPLPGQPGQGNYRITENKVKFNEEHATLVEKHKDDINKQNKLDEAFNASMNKHTMAQLLLIKEEILPRTIKSEQMNLLFPLIKFKSEPKEDNKKEPVLEKVE